MSVPSTSNRTIRSRLRSSERVMFNFRVYLDEGKRPQPVSLKNESNTVCYKPNLGYSNVAVSVTRWRSLTTENSVSIFRDICNEYLKIFIVCNVGAAYGGAGKPKQPQDQKLRRYGTQKHLSVLSAIASTTSI